MTDVLNSGLNSKSLHSAHKFSSLKYTVSYGFEFKTEMRTTVKIINKIFPVAFCIVNMPKLDNTLKFDLGPALTVF